MNAHLKIIQLLAIVLTLASIAHPSFSAAPSAPSTHTTIQQALDQLDASIELSQTTDSGQAVRQAAAVLAFALQKEGVESAAGHLTLANAYFIGHDLGRAILHYRRGLQLDPSNEHLQQNLAHARSFVEPTLPTTPNPTTAKSILQSWHQLIDARTLWFGVVGTLTIASLLWTVSIINSRNRIPMKLPASITALALLGLGLLAFDQWIADHNHAVVVVMPGTMLYSGPGAGVYQEVYDAPLGTGTEAIKLDSKDGWTNIKLGNNQTGWVRIDSITPVIISSK